MSGPVVAFDIGRTKGARLTRLGPEPVETAPALGVVQSKPAAAPAQDPHSLRARHRADLAATYAGLAGVDVSRADLLEAMTAAGGETVTPEVMARAMSSAGFQTRIVGRARPGPSDWPALAEMTSGQIVLVLGQTGDTLEVFDTTCTDNLAEVLLAEFQPVYAGRLLRAEADLATLTARHALRGVRGHWFWGQMLLLRRHFVEVALGSFVANLLAVAVALFSLQVYDRVIPHQSVATLWVLAIGAGLAMLLEAVLRIARARLMDGAGRRNEVEIQTLLMDRVLGMRRGRLDGQSPSQMFSAVRDFGSIREFFTATTIGTLTDLPFIVLFLALVASIGGNVVWVLFAGGILMVLPSFFLQRRMIELTRATQGASTKSTRLLHEAIYDADTIKA